MTIIDTCEKTLVFLINIIGPGDHEIWKIEGFKKNLPWQFRKTAFRIRNSLGLSSIDSNSKVNNKTRGISFISQKARIIFK